MGPGSRPGRQRCLSGTTEMAAPCQMRKSSPWRTAKNRQSAAMTQQNETQNETQPKAGAIIVPVTLFDQNCTIIWHEPSKKAVVIDPGGDVDKIQAAIKQTGVTVEKIWLTHGHIDH